MRRDIILKFSTQIIKTIAVCMAFLIASAPLAFAQQEFSIESEAMQETREIVVHLPKEYNPGRDEGYPVIYMLDAGAADKMPAEIASYYHWGDLMPELIVIGLKNVRRGADLLPHYYDRAVDGDKLLAYIENELIPFADNQLNTNGDNVFAGHSWAGQYLTYALSQSPGLFNAYFITSPAFGDDGKWRHKTFEVLEQTLNKDQNFPDLVYLSMGGDGAPGPLSDAGMLPDYFRLAALLRRHLLEEMKLHHEVYDSANHTSNSAFSMASALQLYFAAAPEIE